MSNKGQMSMGSEWDWMEMCRGVYAMGKGMDGKDDDTFSVLGRVRLLVHNGSLKDRTDKHFGILC